MGDGTAPFGWTWNSITAANGEHILVAVATDAGGNTGTSAPVTVTVDNPPGEDPPALKPVLRGLVDREVIAPSAYVGVVNVAVRRAAWADLQSEAGGPLNLAPIDEFLAAAHDLGVGVKLRVQAGCGLRSGPSNSTALPYPSSIPRPGTASGPYRGSGPRHSAPPTRIS